MDRLDRRTLLLGMLGAAGMATSGCTGGEPAVSATTSPPAPSPPPTRTPTPTPTPTADSRPRWPLRGTLLKDPAAARHPAVAVKVPDNKYEHPQVGIDQADIVFIQLDGYRDGAGDSGTRLVPVFHSRLPDDVGPVRSIRPVDIPLLSPMHAVIGSTGATRWVTAYAAAFPRFLDSGHTYVATQGSGSYSINPDRVRTYQGQVYYDQAVVCHPKVLVRQTSGFDAGPPRAYFPWATGTDEPSTSRGRRARSVAVPYHRDGQFPMSYAWSAGDGVYLRSMPWGPHVLANGKRVAAENILVISAATVYGVIDVRGRIDEQVGHGEPIYKVIEAKGTFTYASGGKAVSGTWRKRAVEDLFTFTLSGGGRLKMTPGRTFVELPPQGSRVRLA